MRVDRDSNPEGETTLYLGSAFLKEGKKLIHFRNMKEKHLKNLKKTTAAII
jgi:hypothetical protein